MQLKQLARLDLNLLVTLSVLLEECNVTSAAERLFLTQPAISKALGRLRDTFDDALFTRSSRGLVPTPFALSLQQPLADLLSEVSDLFLPEEFDPASFKGRFALAVNDFLDLTLMPQVVGELSEMAPGVRLESLSHIENQLSALERGELDAVINLQFSDLGKEFHAELLFSDTPSLFARTDHPLHKLDKVSPDELLLYDRVELMLPDMKQFTMYQQSRLRLNWPTGFVTHSLISALAVVARTDYLLPGPGVLSGFASEHMDFKRMENIEAPPFNINYYLVMHERVRQSAAHQWLKKTILDIAWSLPMLPGKPGA